MNGYERVKAALAGVPADYRPVMMHNFQMAAREAGISMETYRTDPRKAAECHIRAAERYDLDGVFIDVDTATLAGACGCEVHYPRDGVAQVHRGILEVIEDAPALTAVKLEESAAVGHWLEISSQVHDYFGDEKYVRCNCDQAPFSLASMLRGSQDFMMDLMDPDAAENVECLLDYCLDVTGQFIRLAAATGAHGVSNGDSVAGPAMISPAMYRAHAMQYERAVAEIAHDAGVDYILHICGNTDVILPDLAALPADAVELDYLCSLAAVRGALGDRTTLSGTLDPSAVLGRGSVNDVEAATQALLEAYAGSNRLIVCSGCALPPDTPPENIDAVLKIVRRQSNV